MARKRERPPLYITWMGMRHSVRKVPRLKGIEVCPEWQDYPTYEEWGFEHGWEPGKCIVRIDKNKDFCPENCKVVPSRKYISRGRRDVVRLPDGRSVREICGEDANHKQYNCIRRRVLDLKWDANVAVSVPAHGISRTELYWARKEGRMPRPTLTCEG